MEPVRTVAPTDFIDLDEAKAHLRVTHSDDDAYITALIDVANDVLDANTGEVGKALGTQTWDWSIDSVSGILELPVGPVQSVTSIAYYDADNAPQTATVSDFELSDNFLSPKINAVWPALYTRTDAITITFVSGYGAAIPAGIKHAGLLLIGHYFENRDEASVMTVSDIPRGVAALIQRHKTGWIGG